jgi:hypothetical protein
MVRCTLQKFLDDYEITKSAFWLSDDEKFYALSHDMNIQIWADEKLLTYNSVMEPSLMGRCWLLNDRNMK